MFHRKVEIHEIRFKTDFLGKICHIVNESIWYGQVHCEVVREWTFIFAVGSIGFRAIGLKFPLVEIVEIEQSEKVGSGLIKSIVDTGNELLLFTFRQRFCP